MPEIDESSWPIVTVTYPETLTLEEIAASAARLRAIFKRRGPMVTVSDISAVNVRVATPLHRKAVADEADRLAAMGAFIAEATVIRNPFVRVLHIGHSWLRAPTTHSVGTFSDWAPAIAWANKRIRARNSTVSLG